MNLAITIDNRQFERRQERQGKPSRQTVPPRANDSRKRQYPSTAYGHHPGPMDVDANQRDPQPRKDKSKLTCFGCGETGHFKRDCRKRKKGGWKTVPGKETATIERGVPVIEVSA
ncbi:hypothetical protein C8A05DRAFT_20440, partial [Staphylotrichum tortipilum]